VTTGAPTYPDSDQLLVAALAAAFPVVRVCTELPADLEAHLPVVQCNRFGGHVGVVSMDAAWVDVDVWHSNDDAAALLASQIRSWLLLGLVGTRVTCATGTGVFAKVHEQTGAMRRPSGNPDVFRRGMALTITIHATN
jgi:hypothetical protein